MKIIWSYHFDYDPRFPPFILYVRWKSGVTFVRRYFRDERDQKPPSNNKKIHVQIMKFLCRCTWFLTEITHCGPYFVSVTLLCFTLLPFSNICKKICQQQRHASFRTNYVTVLRIPKWLMLKNFYRFSVSFYIFYVIFSYIFNGVMEKIQE